jgi:hypothetical protein
MSANPAPPKPDSSLNTLLVAEFEYIAQATLQSSEDRARVSNYYLVTTGAAVAAILGAKFDVGMNGTGNFAIGVGFFVLALLGVFTLLALIRLRAGWMDGAKAMDKIKEYYAEIYPDAQLFEKSFDWQRASLPPPGKLNSVAFWTAAAAILVDSAMMTMAVAYVGVGITNAAIDPTLFLIGLASAAAFAVMQLYMYWHYLPRTKSGKGQGDVKDASGRGEEFTTAKTLA